MAKQYPHQEDNELTMVGEDLSTYPHSITIPITLPSTGSYNVDYLKKELTDFALKLLYRPTLDKATPKKIHVSERIKALSAVPASSSSGDYKDDFVNVMSEKY